MKNNNEYTRWLDQAENDIKYAKHSLDGGFFSQTCFICQQASEKAIKAIHYAGGKRIVIGHSLFSLVSRLDSKSKNKFNSLLDQIKKLDTFYITTRYPNGIPDGVPYQFFNEEEAKDAIEIAKKKYKIAVELCAQILKKK